MKRRRDNITTANNHGKIKMVKTKKKQKAKKKTKKKQKGTTSKVVNKNAGFNTLEGVLVGTLQAISNIFGVKRIAVTMRFYEDGTNDGTLNYSYSKQRKTKR